MKKNIVYAAAAAFAILLSASCEKQEMPGNIGGSKTFTAEIEQNMTKTTLVDGTKVNWVSGDQININGAVYSAVPGDPASKANFTLVDGTEPEAPYAAIYPADLYVSDGVYEFPGFQYYEAGQLNAPMYAESDNESLSFKNISGVLRISLKGSGNVQGFMVRAEEALCGDFTITDGSKIEFTEGEADLILYCPEAVELNEDTATDFYICVPPQEYSAGMEIDIVLDDGTVFPKVTTKDVTVERNNIYGFNWTIAVDPEYAANLGTYKFEAYSYFDEDWVEGNLIVSAGVVNESYNIAIQGCGWCPDYYDTYGVIDYFASPWDKENNSITLVNGTPGDYGIDWNFGELGICGIQLDMFYFTSEDYFDEIVLSVDEDGDLVATSPEVPAGDYLCLQSGIYNEEGDTGYANGILVFADGMYFIKDVAPLTKASSVSKDSKYSISLNNFNRSVKQAKNPSPVKPTKSVSRLILK